MAPRYSLRHRGPCWLLALTMALPRGGESQGDGMSRGLWRCSIPLNVWLRYLLKGT